MSGQLQVRQRQVTASPLGGDMIDVLGRPGPWVDVLSPGFLVGYVLPGFGFAYEFRNAPEEPD